jgi:uncharacterized membrane protein
VTDRIIVATFNDTNAAYDAASAIKGLKEAGVADFKLKTGVMIKKDDRGNVALLESKDRHLLGTAVGTVTGALIGLIGGAPGMALGARWGRRQDSAAMSSWRPSTLTLSIRSPRRCVQE